MKSPDAMTREELVAEVERLRAELALMHEERLFTALRKTLRMTPVETRLLMALYEARGKPMMAWDLEPMVPSQSRNPRDSNVMAVYVCRIRKAIGKAAIERVWNKGWAITPVGQAAVERALEGVAAGPPPPATPRSPPRFRTSSPATATTTPTEPPGWSHAPPCSP